MKGSHMEELQHSLTNILEGASRSLIDTISIYYESFLCEEVTLLKDGNTKYTAFLRLYPECDNGNKFTEELVMTFLALRNHLL